MACPTPETIVEYVFGGLTAPERRSIEQHTDSCGQCRQEISDLAAGSLATPKTSRPRAGQAHPVAPGDLLGRYVILQRVGAGGMGTVFAAYDPELDRKVALKLLHDGDVRPRLLREARALARLSHPNIVTVHDAGVSDGRLFIAMEYVAGTTLRDWLAREPRAWAQVQDVFVDAARGLAAAHARGLVHRDFKPENVLIDDEGRVRVTDFGVSLDLREARDSRAIEGTPAYMAPEQLDGQATDPRSDQFSFCLTLYEALTKTRPTRAALASEDIAPIPKARAPRHVRDAIVKGLSAEPRLRHESMDELISRIARSPLSGWRTQVGIAVAVVLLGLGAATWWARDAAGPSHCQLAHTLVESTWDETRRAAVLERFKAAGHPSAAQMFERVDRAVSDYRDRWVAMRTEACRATHLRGEQSERLLDRRMQCLDRRKGALGALSGLFATTTDSAIVDNAVQAVAALPDIAACADTDALLARVAPPESLRDRARVQTLRERLDRAQALQRTGKYRAGYALASELVPPATQLGYQPLLAEILTTVGDLQFRLGKYEAATGLLFRAAQTAAAARDDQVSAQAWTLLAGVVGYAQRKREQGLALVQMAKAWVARAASSKKLEAELADVHGLILDVAGDYAAARKHYQRALDLREQLYGRVHLDVALSLNNLAAVPYQQGKLREALSLHQRSLNIREQLLGKDSPDVAVSLNAIAAVYSGQGKYAQARSTYQRALAIWTRTLGPAHPDVAVAHNNLGNVLRALGKYPEAIVHLRRALAIWQTKLGPDHPYVASALQNIGVSCFAQKDQRCALAMFDRVVALRERKAGKSHPSLGSVLVNRGRVHQRAKQMERAAADFRRAVAIFERAGNQANLAWALTTLGGLLVETGSPRQAVAPLERALKLGRRAEGTTAADLAATQFALARALWTTPAQRARAQALANEARTRLRDPDKVAAITSWLATRR